VCSWGKNRRALVKTLRRYTRRCAEVSRTKADFARLARVIELPKKIQKEKGLLRFSFFKLPLCG
jgi:hypothetical protein